MAEPNAGQRLHLDVAQCCALHLGETADLRLGELDVLDHLRRQAVDQRLDFRRGQPEILRLPLVEFHRQLAHRRVAASHDVIEDRLDRLAHLAVGLELLFVGRAALEITDHRTIAPCYVGNTSSSCHSSAEAPASAWMRSSSAPSSAALPE